MKSLRRTGLAALLFPIAVASAACSETPKGGVTIEKPCDERSCETEDDGRRKKRKDELLTKDVEITGEDGTVTVNGLEVLVTDTLGNPLDNKKVYSLSDGVNHFTFVVDNDRHPRYRPQWVEGRLDQRTDELNGQVRQGLDENPFSFSLIMDITTAINDIAERIMDRPHFLEDRGNVNVYCMTAPQITGSIDVAAKVFYLITVASGIEPHLAKVVTTVASESLDYLLINYIHRHYGRFDSYIVSVPKTAITICGEDFNETVCPIDYEELNHAIGDVPAWQVEGPCEDALPLDEGIDGGYDPDAGYSSDGGEEVCWETEQNCDGYYAMVWNSCGEGIPTDCRPGTCFEGRCVDDPDAGFSDDGGSSCTPRPQNVCEGDNVYRVDGCGSRTLVERCEPYQACTNGECSGTRPRFEDLGNGAVRDYEQNVLWEKNPNTTGSPNWEDTIRYCENLVLGGFNDWRLPNLSLLRTLNDDTYNVTEACHLPRTLNMACGIYWSSSPCNVGQQDSPGALVARFEDWFGRPGENDSSNNICMFTDNQYRIMKICVRDDR